MKLLIVDDEKLTREGILKSLPLEKLGDPPHFYGR